MKRWLLVRVLIYGALSVGGLLGTVLTDEPGVWVRVIGAIFAGYLAFSTYRAYRVFQRFRRGTTSD